MQELLQDPPPDANWEKLRPVLDQAMHELKEADRAVILMRYFENHSFADIGQKLGLREDAARKRATLSWVEAWLGGKWVPFDPSNVTAVPVEMAPDTFLVSPDVVYLPAALAREASAAAVPDVSSRRQNRSGTSAYTACP